MAKYKELNLGQIESLVNTVGGMEAVERILSGDVRVVLTPVFRVWKTVKIGGEVRRRFDYYREALMAHGYQSDEALVNILRSIEVIPVETSLDLVMATVGSLGFKTGVKIDKIYNKAKELGLLLCPAEVAPSLRVTYLGTAGECLYIASDPLDTNSAQSLLRVSDASLEIWPIDIAGYWTSDVFVFVKPQVPIEPNGVSEK